MNGFTENTDTNTHSTYRISYFAVRANVNSRQGTLGLIGGVIVAVLGALIVVGIFALQLSVDIEKGKFEIKPYLDIAFISLYITFIPLLASFLMIRRGLHQRRQNSRESLIDKCAVESGYPESVLLDFESQYKRKDVIVTSGYVLTTAYIMLEDVCPCLMKISDIACAHMIYYEKQEKRAAQVLRDTAHNDLHLAFFSKNGTRKELDTNRKTAQDLISKLLAKNPDIDTAEGAIMSRKNYEELFETKYLKHWG